MKFALPVSCTYSGPPQARVTIDEIPDGPGLTVGYRGFDKVGNKFFWDDGTVSAPDMSETLDVFAATFADRTERYSEWTDEKREEVRAACAKRKAELEVENARREHEWQEIQSKHRALLESARKKLTAEEYEAALEEGRCESAHDY